MGSGALRLSMSDMVAKIYELVHQMERRMVPRP